MAKNLSIVFVVAIALMAVVVMWTKPVDGQAALDAWMTSRSLGCIQKLKKPQRCCGYHCISDPRKKYPTGDFTIWWICDYPEIYQTTEAPVPAPTSSPSFTLWDTIFVLANSTRNAVQR